MRVGNSIHDPGPVTRKAPAVETVLDGRRRAVFAWLISPWDAGAQDMEYAVDDTPVIDALLAPYLVGKDRLNQLPLKIAQI